MTKVIVAGIILSLTGCVVMTRRDFSLIKQGEHSVGFMEGLGRCEGNFHAR